VALLQGWVLCRDGHGWRDDLVGWGIGMARWFGCCLVNRVLYWDEQYATSILNNILLLLRASILISFKQPVIFGQWQAINGVIILNNENS